MSTLQSFERTHRLRSAADFDGVFKTGTRASDQYFTVIARPNVIGTARLGVAVSKRNARRAVDRNRLKRLIRESFRRSPVRPLPLDLVIVAKSNATAASGDALRKSLERRWTSLVLFAERLHSQPQR